MYEPNRFTIRTSMHNAYHKVTISKQKSHNNLVLILQAHYQCSVRVT